MMTNRPCAASMPPINAAPYPRSATGTSRAPSAVAIAAESSVLPLSATTTSPAISARLIAASAFRMHVASVSASLRQGITTVTSSGIDSCSGMQCAEAKSSITFRLEGPAPVGGRASFEGASSWRASELLEDLVVGGGLAQRQLTVARGIHVLRQYVLPARAIQELAGPQDLGTTQRYMHLSP